MGDTDRSEAYASQNQLCYDGPQEGMALCEGTGRYLIWELKNNVDLYFNELYVYDMKDKAQSAAVSFDPTSAPAVTNSTPL